MRMENKTAIITGGATGIGRAICLLFAEEGAAVTVADINDAEGQETVRLIEERGGNALYCHTDVTSSDEIRRMVAETLEKFGEINIVVNDAAHMRDFATVLDTTEEQWDRSIDVTLKGVFLTSKYAIPELIKFGGGSIVNISSVGGVVGFAHYAGYCSAKGGVVQLTKSMAIDYGRRNVRVNVVSPGAIETSASRRVLDEKASQYQIEMSVLGRTGQPLEVAYAALFLASDESSFVTGINLIVDGGWTAR
jgi:NAD(P)-dependent dehydrogenase (short-subunit alcohol dehydrogenase family)